MIIKVVEDKFGIGKLIGLRRKNNNDFEMTMESEMDCDSLLNGIMINGQECEIRKLCATERMVSFLSLPSCIRGRNYPKTDELGSNSHFASKKEISSGGQQWRTERVL